MGHKKKKNKLNKMLKAQQMQQISLGQVLPPTPATANVAVTPAATAIPQAHQQHVNREILRTVISLVVVAALLIGAVIIDHRTHYFTDFGAWLFKTLRLANK